MARISRKLDKEGHHGNTFTEIDNLLYVSIEDADNHSFKQFAVQPVEHRYLVESSTTVIYFALLYP